MSSEVSANVEQFKESFREEAREIVLDLEAALLSMIEDPVNQQLVDRVFRGLHTIKGSGAMFGFEELAAFTHDLETAFDQVRTGKLEAGRELMDATLAALDEIRSMLEGSGGASRSTNAARAEVLKQVRALAGIGEPTVKKAANEMRAVVPVAEAENEKEWLIRFAPGPEMLLNGTDPMLLLRELRQLGGLSIRANLDALPPLAEIEPECCYVEWELVLSTAAGRDAIRDVFIFVEDGCALRIEPAATRAAARSEAGVGRATQVGGDFSDERNLPDKESRVQEKATHGTSLRVPAAKLDQFVDLVGELVTVQARLSEKAARSDDPEISEVAEEVERLTSALRENSMRLRMVPVRGTFEKFRRLVHDLARDLGKQVELTMEGAETELDKTVIEQLGDPLMHLIRNSMDHGVEPAAVRREKGKRATAAIHLSARHSGANVLIAVADDGAGIDLEAVRNRATERGLISPGASLSQEQTFALLFEPGFSTAAQVTDVSGRGVGMDVVRRNVEALRGAIDVKSEPGKGTTVTLRLPLTLAIIDGLLLRVGGARFVLPLANTLECIELSHEERERGQGKHVINVREEIVPYIRLREYFHIRGRPPELEQVMVVETSDGRYGFVVDEVLGDCQTVIKNLGRFYRHVQVISGATILGDGSVALILDPERLAQEAVRSHQERMRGHPIVRLQLAGSLGSADARQVALQPGEVSRSN